MLVWDRGCEWCALTLEAEFCHMACFGPWGVRRLTQSVSWNGLAVSCLCHHHENTPDLTCWMKRHMKQSQVACCPSKGQAQLDHQLDNPQTQGQAHLWSPKCLADLSLIPALQNFVVDCYTTEANWSLMKLFPETWYYYWLWWAAQGNCLCFFLA